MYDDNSIIKEVDLLDNESVERFNKGISKQTKYHFNNCISCGVKTTEGFSDIQTDACIDGIYTAQLMTVFKYGNDCYLVAKIVQGKNYNKIVVMPVIADLVSIGSVDLFTDLNPEGRVKSVADSVANYLNSVDIIKLMKEQGNQVLKSQIKTHVFNEAEFPEKGIYGLLLPNQELTMLIGVNHEEFEALRRYSEGVWRFSSLIDRELNETITR